MSASLRALAMLAGLALVLAIAVVVDAARTRAVVDRALVPALAVERISELRLARPGEPVAQLARRGDAWRWLAPDVPAEPRAVDAMLAALRGGRWHRSAERAAAGALHATLDVVADGRTISIGIGLALPGADQSWLAIGDAAYLVDDWVAAALAPARLDLRIRHPFAEAGSVPVIEMTNDGGLVRIEGHPRRVVLPYPYWPARERVAALEAALAELELVGLDAPPQGPTDVIELRVGQARLRGGTPCDHDRVAVHGIGEGCVETGRWLAAVGAASLLGRTAAPGVVESSPLPFDPIKLVLPGGAVIDRARRPMLDGRDADPDRVAELVAALATPALAVAMPPTAARPSATITATAADHTELALELYDGVVFRRGESVALKPPAEAWAAIARPASAYADPTRWLEEPTTISSITVDRRVHARGAVLGEWSDAKDPALLEALAQALAAVRAPAGAPPASIEHRVDVAITPPAGAPVTHHLELGRLGPGGCAGRADGTAVTLPLPLCTAVLAVTH